jgi:hypothetical protein
MKPPKPGGFFILNSHELHELTQIVFLHQRIKISANSYNSWQKTNQYGFI